MKKRAATLDEIAHGEKFACVAGVPSFRDMPEEMPTGATEKAERISTVIRASVARIEEDGEEVA